MRGFLRGQWCICGKQILVYSGGDMLDDVDGIFKETAVSKLLVGGGRREGVGLVWLSTG